jgi:dihydrofolate synthase/folylpolyglutamate synthase
MQALMTYLDNPQEKLRIVHVAGTSGKTSTAYYVAALLEASGATVGLTVSPHVDEVNERVQINRVPLLETTFCQELTAFLELVEASGIRPSYFELMVAFAFWEFAKLKVDYAVMEVGLGGLLDSTNVVTRTDKVCIVTDIGLDHTDRLGNTLGEIAAQKAGIIQTHNQAFMYQQSDDVMTPVQTRSVSKGAILHVISPKDIMPFADLPIFQQRNFFLAKQAVDFVIKRDSDMELTQEQIQVASQTHIPARMEIFKVSGKTIIVDGSHNSQKLGVLAESIRAKFPEEPIAAVVGFVQDLDERWQRGVDVLIGFADHLVITAFETEQDMPKTSMDPERIAAYCHDKGYAAVGIEHDPKVAFHNLLERSEPILLITGSFYLLNHIRPLLV